jgi:GT2 family glycosyltransferase
MTAAHLPLSILIASYRAELTIAGCLASLRAQAVSEAHEIIVVDSSPTGATADIVTGGFPEAQCVREAERKFAGDARNVGLALARGEIIAQIDADCTADPDWMASLLRAHRQSPALAIGGAIGNANPDSLTGWAAYFAEFSRWMPGTAPQWMDDVAGANMSYKRRAFEEFGPYLAGTYCADTEFHWRLARAGHRVWFEPTIRVDHRNIDHPLALLAHEYRHGRSFARVRTGARRFSRFRRGLYAVGCGLIVLRLLQKIGRCQAETSTYRARFATALPPLTAVLLAWSLGEGVGYLQGAPDQVRGA